MQLKKDLVINNQTIENKFAGNFKNFTETMQEVKFELMDESRRLKRERADFQIWVNTLKDKMGSIEITLDC